MSASAAPEARGKGALLLGLAAAFCLVAALRTWRLSEVPRGLYVDERSYAYNALCLLESGKDQFGVAWPVYFQAYGEYKKPLLVYTATAAFGLFGVSATVLRSCSVAWSLAGCAALGWLAWLFTRRRGAGVAGFLLAGLLPWSFPYGRLAFDAGILPGALALGTGLAWIGMEPEREFRRAAWALAGSGLAFALAFYAYTAGQLFAPLLLVVTLLGARRPAAWREAAARGAVVAGGFVVGLVPWAAHVLRQGLGAWVASQMLGAKNPGGGPAGAWTAGDIAGAFFSYFSPRFLFLAGDPNPRHHTGIGGELPVALALPLLVGLVLCCRAWREPGPRRVVALAFLVFPAAAAFRDEPYHATRTINAVPWVVCLVVLGTWELADWLRRRRLFPLLGVILLAAALELSRYYLDYFGGYAARSEPSFDSGLSEAVVRALEIRGRTGGPLYLRPLPQQMLRDNYDLPYQPIDMIEGTALFARVPGFPAEPERLERAGIIPLAGPPPRGARPGSVLIAPAELAPPGWTVRWAKTLVLPDGSSRPGIQVLEKPGT